MPRLKNDQLCFERRQSVLAAMLVAEAPLKMIAADHGIAESTCRNIIWSAGYHAMLVSAEERGRIVAARRLDREMGARNAKACLMPKAGVRA